MVKLKPEIKEQFLAKLRSGEYDQITGQLRGSGRCRCVLGVLGEVLVEKGLAEWKSRGDTAWKLCVDGKPNIAGYGALPTELYQEACIGMQSEKEDPDDTMRVEIKGARPMRLWMANDRGTHSFLQLADIIEEQL